MAIFSKFPGRFLFPAVLILLSVGTRSWASQVVAWGSNTLGQTNVPPLLTNAIALAGGLYHSLALKADGTVIAWGENRAGQTNVPAGLSNVVAISAGNSHCLALRANGTVVAWGLNVPGQAAVPAGLTGVVAIAAGYFHNLALKADGTVVAWGKSTDASGHDSGQTNVPSGLKNVVAITAGAYYSVALKADGTLTFWGNLTGPPSLTNIVAISAGATDGLALKANGQVAEWGSKGFGETTMPTNLANVIGIAAGGFHSLALRANGTVVAWGAGGAVTNRFPPFPPSPPNFGQSIVPADLTNVTAIAGGGYHSLALVGDGAPVITTALNNRAVPHGMTALFRVGATGATPLRYQWRFNGADIQGATNASLAVTNAQFDQAGEYSVRVSNILGSAFSSEANLSVVPLMISSQPRSQSTCQSATVAFTMTIAGIGPFRYQWRFNGVDLPGATNSVLVLNNLRVEQSGLYSVAVANSVGFAISEAAALSVSPILTWGFNEFGETNLPFWLTNVTAVAGGDHHSAALRADGTVVAWGNNSVASVITGQTNVPPGLSNVVALACGARHTLALKSDGTVVGWGQISLPSLNGVKSLAAGWHSLALRSNGTVVAWGNYNNYGELNVPFGLSNVVAVAAGHTHSLALKDGRVIGWGDNGWGQASPPAGLSNVVSIAAGYQHSVALKGDGTVTAWGANYSGATNVPPNLTNVIAISAGGHHGLALKGNGELIAWGDSTTTALKVPSAATNVVAFSAGAGHDIVLVGAVPAILVQPVNQQTTVSSNVTFNVVVTGTPTLKYQWVKDGNEIPAATNSILTLTNLQVEAAGGYSVRITNRFGSVVSSLAQLTVNRPPVANAAATVSMVISPNGSNGVVVLDGSRSYDPDGDVLHYSWFRAGATDLLASGVVAVVVLPVGTHELTLSVADALSTARQNLIVAVVTTEQAVARLIALVTAEVEKDQPLVATLSAAIGSLRRGDAGAAVNQLQAFQHQVQAQVEPTDSVLAATLNRKVEDIIGILSNDSSRRNVGPMRLRHGAKAEVQFSATRGQLYIIEASTNLVDWEKVGVALECGPDEFRFEDVDAERFQSRYYRLITP